MRATSLMSNAALFVALAAFVVTGSLSLRAQVEPLYAVLRSIGAFAGVLCLARWSAGALDALGLTDEGQHEQGGSGPSQDVTEPHEPTDANH